MLKKTTTRIQWRNMKIMILIHIIITNTLGLNDSFNPLAPRPRTTYFSLHQIEFVYITRTLRSTSERQIEKSKMQCALLGMIIYKS